MKKNWIFGVAVCGILSVSDSAYGQSIKDILNSAAVKDAVTAVTGGKKADSGKFGRYVDVCGSCHPVGRR